MFLGPAERAVDHEIASVRTSTSRPATEAEMQLGADQSEIELRHALEERREREIDRTVFLVAHAPGPREVAAVVPPRDLGADLVEPSFHEDAVLRRAGPVGPLAAEL